MHLIPLVKIYYMEKRPLHLI